MLMNLGMSDESDPPPNLAGKQFAHVSEVKEQREGKKKTIERQCQRMMMMMMENNCTYISVIYARPAASVNLTCS